MKIAIIIEHFDAMRGGAEHVAVWLAGQLAARGHEVHVICHDVAPRVSKYRQATLRASHVADRSHRAHAGEAGWVTDGLHVHSMRGMKLQSALGFRMFGRKARLWVQQHKPDITHSMSVAFPGDVYHAYAGVYAALQKHAAASRVGVTGGGARGSWKRVMAKLPGKQRTLLMLERSAVAGPAGVRAKCVLSQCEMTSREFATAFPAAAKNIVTMTTPRVDLPGERTLSAEEAAQKRAWLRSHYGIAPTDRVALFVGHDFRRKGLRYAIEAVARTQGWKLLVVGLGKTREYVELAEDLHIGPSADGGSRILFVGPTREMQAIYAAGDALLMPAFYEPSSLVVLEALSHGLPVVATEFLGAAELVRRAQVGTIVASPREVAELSRALEALPAAGTAQQLTLATRARESVAGISPAAYVDAIVALYERVRHG